MKQCPTPHSQKYLVFLQADNSSHALLPAYNISSFLMKTYPDFIIHIKFNLFLNVFSDLVWHLSHSGFHSTSFIS